MNIKVEANTQKAATAKQQAAAERDSMLPPEAPLAMPMQELRPALSVSSLVASLRPAGQRRTA